MLASFGVVVYFGCAVFSVTRMPAFFMPTFFMPTLLLNKFYDIFPQECHFGGKIQLVYPFVYPVIGNTLTISGPR